MIAEPCTLDEDRIAELTNGIEFGLNLAPFVGIECFRELINENPAIPKHELERIWQQAVSNHFSDKKGADQSWALISVDSFLRNQNQKTTQQTAACQVMSVTEAMSNLSLHW